MVQRALRAIGIESADGGLFPIRLRRRFGGVVLGCVVLGVVGSGVFFWQSSKSWFCASCHLMEPYVASWRESRHGQEGVECVECHFPPGLKNAVAGKLQAASMLVAFLTGTYDTSVVAEIEDASCMRPGCHEERLLEGKVAFNDVHFDHKPHLTKLRRGKRLRCQTCHSQIVQGSHITVTESVCFTCHFKDHKHGRVEDPVGGCTGCHDVPEGPLKLVTGNEYDHADYAGRGVACYKCHFDSVQGDGRVPRQVCLGCHKEPEHLARYDDHQFMHRNHVTDHKVECFHCHTEIRHGSDPEPEPGEPACARCHEGKHDYTAQIYRGTGARGVEDAPSAMWAAKVQCIACHQILGGLPGHAPHSTYEAGETSCIECHGEDVEGMLAMWKEEMATLVKESETALASAREAASSLETDQEKKEAARRLDDAQHNLHLVRYGRGVHNLNYAMNVLEAVNEAAAEVTAMAEGKASDGDQ
ncbi:MAG: NapC/NirT family cytochrome c [Planctomycetota bacterium]